MGRASITGGFVNTPKKPPASRGVDKPASNDWQASAPRAKAAAPSPNKRPAGKVRKTEAWIVTPEDLTCLDAVRDLLSALNNAYVSTSQIQKLILDIPVLAARCMRRIGVKQQATPESLAKALTTIGNMGLENELLGLLEDLTTCRADLLDAEESAVRSPSEPAG
jgi:hypothetical protein